MRGIIRFLLAGTAAAALAGCADSATSPNQAGRTVEPGDRPSLDVSGGASYGVYHTTTFTLSAAGGTYKIGDAYKLSVPSNAVCVLGSSYGAGTWNDDCRTLGANDRITVTATYGFANGGPVVNFSPDLRFAPQANVTLSTDLYASVLVPYRSFFEANPSALRYFGVYYTDNMGATGKTDAAVDKSLATHISLKTGQVWRRIKHFSGYNVTSGMPCDPSPDDPNCIETNPVVERQ